MDWEVFKDALRELLVGRDLQARMLESAIAIEYADRCDVFVIERSWVDQQTTKSPAAAAAERLAEFDRIDAARSNVLNALRHFARRMNLAIERSVTGRWGFTTGLGASGDFDVGARLTRLVSEHDRITALRDFLQEHVGRVPSERLAARLLSCSAPPTHEIPPPDDDAAPVLSLSPRALALDFSALDDPDFAPSNSTEFIAKLTPHLDSPGQRVIERLTERIGTRRFSIDLCFPGAANFKFSDDKDAFRVRARGPRMKRMLQMHGVDGLVEHLTALFERLDRDRTTALAAVDAFMARRGLSKEQMTLDGSWWYGVTHRRYRFRAKTELTRRLRRRTPAEAILEWTREVRLDPPASLDEVESAIDAGGPQPVVRTLPIDAPERTPQLISFESLDIPQLNELAAELIAELKNRAAAQGKRRLIKHGDILRLYEDRLWYDRGGDTWTDDAWWIEQARIDWQRRVDARSQGKQVWFPATASALILLVNGDDSPKEPILADCRGLEDYDDEAIDASIAWLLRDELPWKIDDGEIEDPPPLLGPRPPQIARRIAAEVREQLADPDYFGAAEVPTAALSLDRVTAAEWLTADELEALHARCRNWAACVDSPYTFWSREPLTVAAKFGWTDVIDALEQNPVVVFSLLQWDTSRMTLGEFAQQLSLVKPGRYTARWAAHAMLMDIKAEARTTAESIATADRSRGGLSTAMDIPKTAKWFQKHHIASLGEQQMAAAIAWHRCREAGFPT